MRLAKGRRHVAGRMNSYEAEYEKLFLGTKPHGFEELTFRLGDDCRYTPDFWVMADDDVIELHEVKGRWMDGAKEKIRTAAERYPQFRWVAFRKLPRNQGGGWVRERFGPEDIAA